MLLNSSELDEVLALADRIAVIYRGRIVGVVDRADANRERIGLLMAGAVERGGRGRARRGGRGDGDVSTATDAPPEPPAEPPAPADGGPPDESPGHRALAWLASLGNALVIPVLALVTALVVGGLVIIFTDPDTLDEWGSFFSDPMGALQASWDVVYEAYHALWESSLGSPQAIGRTLVEATPLRSPACRWRWRSGPGCSTSGRPASS